jgi:hypothetical protein
MGVANPCEHKHGGLTRRNRFDKMKLSCENQAGHETISPRVTREVPVEGVEATRAASLEVERPLKQEVSFDM